MKAPDDGEYDVALGSTFSDSREQYHALGFNMKPTSLDTTKQGFVKMMHPGHINVQYHNVNNPNEMINYEGSNTSKKNSNLECILIFENGSFRLERLSSSYVMKKKSSSSAPPAESYANDIGSPSNTVSTTLPSKKKLDGEDILTPSQNVKKTKLNEYDLNPSTSITTTTTSTDKKSSSRSSSASSASTSKRGSSSSKSNSTYNNKNNLPTNNYSSSSMSNSGSRKPPVPSLNDSMDEDFMDMAKELEQANNDVSMDDDNDIVFEEYVGGESVSLSDSTNELNAMMMQEMDSILDDVPISPPRSSISSSSSYPKNNNKSSLSTSYVKPPTVINPPFVTNVNPPGVGGSSFAKPQSTVPHNQTSNKQPPQSSLSNNNQLLKSPTQSSDTSDSESDSESSSYSSSESESSSSES